MLQVFYVLIALAILFMLRGLVTSLRIKKIASGGAIGKVVNLLAAFVVVFTCCYLAAPFMPLFSKETTR